jgi:hypothetical protein
VKRSELKVYYITEQISLVSSIRILQLIPGGPHGQVVVGDGDQSFPADDADDGIVFPHVVLHLLLHEGVVLDQIVQMFLAEEQILLQLAIGHREVLVYSVDLAALEFDLGQLLAAVDDGLVELFWIGGGVLMMALSSLDFSFSILTRLPLCLASLVLL